MNIWVMTGSYEGEHFASTHFTQKGAMLAGIADMLEFLGVEDEETALQQQERCRPDLSTGSLWEWDQVKLRAMALNELTVVFGEWAELAWDNDRGYTLEIVRTQVAA